jgi:hypothetical protein
MDKLVVIWLLGSWMEAMLTSPPEMAWQLPLVLGYASPLGKALLCLLAAAMVPALSVAMLQ